MQHRFPQSLALVVSCAIALPAALAHAASPASAGKAIGTDYAQVAPLLAKYCNGCHNGEKKKGELDLAQFAAMQDRARVKEVAVWQSVGERIEAQDMPPDDKPQPTAAEQELLLAWVDAAQSRFAALGKPDPGRVTLRRLNRTEYDNTVRDLVGLDLEPARDFPSDDVGYGFDNIGDVLTLPPVLLERYMQAAERIASRAIVAEVPPRSQKATIELDRLVPTPAGSSIKGGKLLVPKPAGPIALRTGHDFPVSAEYVFRLRGSGRAAGNEPARVTLRIDGREVKALPLGGALTIRTSVEGGPRRIELGFTNVKALALDALVIEGPILPKDWTPPPSHLRLIPHAPPNENRESWRHHARELLTPLVARAYRRPANAGEVERVARFVDGVTESGGTFEQGMQLALRAVLVSPHFLFRPELDQPDPTLPAAAERRLDDHELASRLSYFLWSSMPDDELFRLAAEGKLREPAVLAAQARRMLADPRAAALTANFATQWLQIRNLLSHRANKKQFPDFDDELKVAMVRETELFFEEVMRRDLSLLTFLDADFTFVNEKLAKHYGIPDVMGESFRKISLAGSPRGGVLTHGSVLTVTSNPTRTSPVKRGRWVLEQLLGTPPPPPPPGVPELEERKKGGEKPRALRVLLEQHRADPNCAVCHKKMDPLGLGLENFDAVGAWREQDGGEPIDPSGTLPTGQTFRGPAELKKILLEREPLFRRSLASKLLTYALGRGVNRMDRPAVDRICEDVARGGGTFSSLVLGVIKSDPFLKRRGPQAEHQP
jgi:hypothetical protein